MANSEKWDNRPIYQSVPPFQRLETPIIERASRERRTRSRLVCTAPWVRA